MRLALLLLSIGFLCSSASAEIRLKTRVEGLDAPESAFFDEQMQLVFVSTMGNGGDAIRKNGAGGITILSADGSLLVPNWITGLNSPKGVFSFLKNRLLIAEKDSIRVVEMFQAVPGTVPVARDSSFTFPVSTKSGAALLLNDLVVAGGNVYVTDTFANKIYKISGLFMAHLKGSPPIQAVTEEFVTGLQLLSPNGIAFDGAKLWVVGTDTYTGYGNLTTPILDDRREMVVPADFEKPMVKMHPSLNPGANLKTLAGMLRSNPELAAAQPDPANPNLVPDAKNPRERLIDPANSFFKAHHAKVYSVDLESREVTILPQPDGGFDGVALDATNREGFRVLVGDFGAGKIMSVRQQARRLPEVRDVITVEKSIKCAIPTFCSNPADFSVNVRARLIYVPNLSGGEVQTYSLD